MTDLSDIRARLRDRQKKAGALGTTDTTLCLDLELIEQLEALKQERGDAVTPDGKPRLGAASAGTADLDGQIAAKEDEIRAASIRVVFRALSSSKYQELLNAHPEANDTSPAFADFLNAVAEVSLHEVWQGNEKVNDVTWDDLREGCSYGEWDIATTKVLALNRRAVDVPFSLKPSKATLQR